MARKKEPTRNAAAEESSDVRAVYVISVAAELAGVHPQTLRIYERLGLVNPARTAGNTRRYSDHDIRRVQLIQGLTRGQGLNLAGVQMILAMEDRLEQMRRRMERLDRELVSAQQRMALELVRLRRESVAGELVPVASVRRMDVRAAIAADRSLAGRVAIPMGPARENDEQGTERAPRRLRG